MSMPQTRRSAIVAILFTAAFILIPGTAPADFWKKLDAFFSAPPLDHDVGVILVGEGWAYLHGKDEVFQSKDLLRDVQSFAPTEVETLADGTRLEQVYGFHDVEVTALVAFDNGRGYRYGPGETLAVRLYTAALVRRDAGGAVDGYRARVLALRNMSNPESREGELALREELRNTPAFSEEERRELAQGVR